MLSLRALLLGALLNASHLVSAAADAAAGPMDSMKLVPRAEAVAANEAVAALAPDALSKEKKPSNGKMLMPRELSLDTAQGMSKRQQCPSGYGYCSSFGRCCPSTDRCCEYGYCLSPGEACCRSGSCDPGYTCCGSKCAPRNGDCCSNDSYCESGNICVRLNSSGRIVCCTNTQCTAVVVGGTTSRLSSSGPTATVRASTPPSITPAATTIRASVSTYYWTVRWWYIRFYYTTIQATSRVTYSTVYTTTIYSVSASGYAEASSSFRSISSTLTFTPPADASTQLRSQLTAAAVPTPSSRTPDSTFALDTNSIGLGNDTPDATDSATDSPSSPTSSSTTSTTSSSASAASAATGTASTASARPASFAAQPHSPGAWLAACMAAAWTIPAVLMIWL